MRASPFSLGPTRMLSSGIVVPAEPGVLRRYPTLLDPPGSQYPEIVQDQPEYLEPVQFGDLETVVVRITDASSDRHNYATRQAFNADQTVCMLNGDGESVWLDTSDWSEIRRGGPALLCEFADPVDPDLWWGSQNWTNRIGRYNLDTNSMQSWVVPPPSGAAYSEVHIGQGEGTISDDGRYIPVVCQRGDGNAYVAVWDTVEEEVEGTLVLTGWSVGGDFDNAHISRSGQYLIIASYRSGDSGHIVYDRATLARLYKYETFPGHMDVGYRSDGTECMMRLRTDGAFVTVRLSDGQARTEVSGAAMSWGNHISGQARNRAGYAYISMTYLSSQTAKYLYREVIAVKLDGSGQIERWGQAMFPASSGYELEAKVTASPYGDMVLMTSGWGTTTPREYVMYVPETMP